MKKSAGTNGPTTIETIINFIITVTLWLYFTVGFVVFFSPFYVASFFSQNPEAAFQRLNHIFFKVFFSLVRAIIPRTKWQISDEVANLKSSIIVSNHVSYLDPILLISLFEKNKTIAKSDLFNIAIFGKMLELTGYIPSTAEGRFSQIMIRHIESMGAYLASGGNFFVFPEGTRSRDGKIGTLNKGVFKVARHCQAPVKVLYIKNTDKLFTPGRFLFNTLQPNTVTVELIATISPDYKNKKGTVSELNKQIKTLLEKKNNDESLHQPTIHSYMRLPCSQHSGSPPC